MMFSQVRLRAALAQRPEDCVVAVTRTAYIRVDQIRGLPFVTRNDFARLCLATEARAQT